VGRVLAGIDPLMPNVPGVVAGGWQLEVERLPIGVQDQMQSERFPPQINGESHAV
jgi:hypothetical protein